jgi:2-polyprenyl-3-methyl-5-hydroxy-6-metoxy-1,4-benzoquinol methylase
MRPPVRAFEMVRTIAALLQISTLALHVLVARGTYESGNVYSSNPEDANVIRDDWKSNFKRPEGVEGSQVYSDLYNHLYDSGKYHGAGPGGAPALGSHAQNIVHYLRNMSLVRSVFDVGCSHGRGVQMLWQSGKVAAGVDIARLGVQHAIEWRCKAPVVCDSNRCGPAPSCFQVGSALQIPTANKSYDALISTDVLEHIFMDDVPIVLGEFTRVARRIIVVKVASMVELSARTASLLKTKRTHGVQNLHVTSQKLDWWQKEFEKLGWTLKDELRKLNYRGFYSGFEASFMPM